MEIESFGKLLLVLGAALILLSAIVLIFSRVPVLNNFGNLPGDFRIKNGSFACFFPLASMCLLSLVASIAINLAARIFAR